MLGEGRVFREKAEKTCQGQVGKGLASEGKGSGAATVAQVRGAQPSPAMPRGQDCDSGSQQWLHLGMALGA